MQGTFAANLANCKTCEFYGLVKQEEGFGMVPVRDILTRVL